MAEQLIGDPICAGFILSNAFAVAALLIFYRYTKDLLNAEVSYYAAMCMLLFPASFILSAVMSESLFLLTTVAALRCAQKQYYLCAGILGMLSALTRSVGILLVAPLALMAIGIEPLRVSISTFLSSIWQHRVRLLKIASVPFGLLLFGTYVYQLTGDPLAVADVQKHWGREAISVNTVLKYLLAEQGIKTALYTWAILGLLLLVIYNWRQLPLGLFIWTLLMILIPLSNGSQPVHLASMPRFLAVTFPLFILFAIMLQQISALHRRLIATLSIGLLTVFAGSWAVYEQFIV